MAHSVAGDADVRAGAARLRACLHLLRYVLWCARTRRFDRLRNAVDLLIEVVDGAASRPSFVGSNSCPRM
jgi:hypothetical protein